MSTPLLRVSGIAKRFPGVQALDGVGLEVRAGEVHGLLGENGAGKSTLLKILSGAQQPDAGTIAFDGRPTRIETPLAAQRLGIATIYQEFNLIPSLSIAENLFLSREPGGRVFVDWRALDRQARAALDRIGLALDPSMPVGDLSVAEQQMVEIGRALTMRARLIIMDEPTSALTEQETQRLFEIVRGLRSQGISIIFVTHRLGEVMTVCDRVTVLRDGRPAGEGEVSGLTIDRIIQMMVGRSASQLFQPFPPREPGEVALRVRGLGRTGTRYDPDATVLEDIGFEVRRGEILGIAGLIGSGRTELARCIFGADRFDRGTVEVAGRAIDLRSPLDAIRNGIGLVPEDRKQQALFLDLAVRQNLSIAALGRLLRWRAFVDERAEDELIERFRARLNIRMSGPEQTVSKLSGGNQQKVVLARWMALDPKVLIVDEPTRGIDVAAKSEVHQHLDRMARSGMAVIAISSELPEVLAISDRIMTMREGRVTGIVPREGATEESLMQLMVGAARAAA